MIAMERSRAAPVDHRESEEAAVGDERDLRRNLHKLLNDTKERQHEIAACPFKLRQQMQEANALITRVKKPTDASLDSEVLNLLAHGGVEIVRKAAHGSIKYNIEDYIRRLKHKYVEDPENVDVTADPHAFKWGELGRSQFSAWFRPAPGTTHMLGPMDAAPPPKRTVVRQKKRKVVVGEGVRPDLLEEGDILDGDAASKETDKNMETMWKILGEQPQAKAFMIELCLNHDSFSQTVENIFSLSFLVRDGKVCLQKHPEGIVVTIAPQSSQKKQKDGQKSSKERLQFVMSLSMREWNQWRKAVSRENTLMPLRMEGGDAPGPSSADKRSKVAQ